MAGLMSRHLTFYYVFICYNIGGVSGTVNSQSQLQTVLVLVFAILTNLQYKLLGACSWIRVDVLNRSTTFLVPALDMLFVLLLQMRPKMLFVET